MVLWVRRLFMSKHDKAVSICEEMLAKLLRGTITDNERQQYVKASRYLWTEQHDTFTRL